MARRRIHTTTEADLNPNATELGYDERLSISNEPYRGYGVTPELRERLRENAERNELEARREYLRRKAHRHLS